MASEGELGNVGEPLVSLTQSPAWGTGCPQALACARGFHPDTSPHGRPQTPGSTQGIGTRATSDATREGQDGSRRVAEYR